MGILKVNNHPNRKGATNLAYKNKTEEWKRKWLNSHREKAGTKIIWDLHC